jgi:hypothetical protein
MSLHDWESHATLVLHSDGISVHWGEGLLDDVLRSSASVLADAILTRLRRGNDDATVVVMKRAEP